MRNYVLLIALSTIPLLTICQNPSQDSNWEVGYQDDFNSFNTNVWSKANNYVHGSNSGEEPQVYTANNVYIENGKITDTKRMILTK